MKRKILFLLTLVFLVVSCSKNDKAIDNPRDEFSSDWSNDSSWFKVARENTVDFFYIVSTEVISAKKENGSVSYRSLLVQNDRNLMTEEISYVEKNIAKGDFNFIAPYYHQFTFDAIGLPAQSFDSVYSDVVHEVREAFDYYIKHVNNGRRFVLAGFSQGGMLVLDLLKGMDEETYGKMVAAYALGYRIAKEDTLHKYIRPASGETETGVTVSFNSALSKNGVWPLVAGGAVAVINPVNWKTDATPAEFVYDGRTHEVSVDTTLNLLIVKVDSSDVYRNSPYNKFFQSVSVNPDCLHHFDLLFYMDYLHDNMLKRAEIKKSL